MPALSLDAPCCRRVICRHGKGEDINRATRSEGFFVGFGNTSDTQAEMQRFPVAEHKMIRPLTVREILDEEVGRILA